MAGNQQAMIPRRIRSFSGDSGFDVRGTGLTGGESILVPQPLARR
jgi:hypothetical protein